MYKFNKTSNRDLLATRNEPFTEDVKNALPGMRADTSFETARATYLEDGGAITHGPTVWARGALRFSPGWDSNMRVSSANIVEGGGEFFIGKNSAGVLGREELKNSDDDQR